MEDEQWSTLVPNTARNDRGDIRRSKDACVNQSISHNGCKTLYECFRRGASLNPMGACLGFRAVSTSGLATPYIYTSYTETLARVNAFAAGLDSLDLVSPNEDGMKLVRDNVNCVKEGVNTSSAAHRTIYVVN